MPICPATRSVSPASLVLLFSALLFLSSCGEETSTKEAAPPSPKSEGWQILFNGQDLSGWIPKIKGYPAGVNYARTFRVEDGVIKVDYTDYEGKFAGRFGHLFYEHEYSNYVLELEYRFTGDQVPGGPGWAFRNSGIMIHGQPIATMGKDQDFPVSIEVQLLGGDGQKERPTGNLCTPGTHVVMDGKLIKRHCTDSTSKTYHGDQWVTIRVEVRGNTVIEHRVDGELVLSYEKPQLDEGDANARAWIERRGGETMLSGGSISLQSESHPCEFRNIRLKPL